MDTVTPVTEQPPTQPSKKKRNLIIAGIAVLAAAGTAIGVAVSGGGAGSFTLKGTLTLNALGSGDSTNPLSPADGDPCITTGGYTDIAQGATVTIGGSTGQSLAVTGLSAGVETGVETDDGVALGTCVFKFSVEVPAGQSAYTVTISHRGTQTFTPAQAQAGVTLSLGS